MTVNLYFIGWASLSVVSMVSMYEHADQIISTEYELCVAVVLALLDNPNDC